MNETPEYIQILNLELEKKRGINPKYSIRAFARFLEIDQSTLSSILSNKRHLPKKYINSFAKKLDISQNEKNMFIESAEIYATKLKNVKKKKSERHQLSLKDFEKVATPESFAILTLLELDQFRYDIDWIANTIQTTPAEVKTIINDLIDLKLVEEIGGTLYKTKNRVTTPDEISSEYIVNFHTRCLKDAIRACQDLAPQKRYFSTITLPTNIKLLDKAKLIIREFEDKLESLLDQSNTKKDLMRLSVQLYPLMEKE